MNVNKLRGHKYVSNGRFNEFPFCEDINKLLKVLMNKFKTKKRKWKIEKIQYCLK